MRDDILWYIPGLCGASETTMWHSRQASATVFPHVSLFTKHDDSAKTVPVRCCSWRACVWFFRSIATTSFERIYPGSKHFVWSGFFQIVFLSALFVGFHSPYQSTLIPVPPSISLMALQGLYPASLIIGPKCSMPPRPIHPLGNRVPNEKADVNWMCFPGSSGASPSRRALSPQNSWTFSFMLP